MIPVASSATKNAGWMLFIRYYQFSSELPEGKRMDYILPTLTTTKSRKAAESAMIFADVGYLLSLLRCFT
jgi:hypothetical protein